MKKYLVKNDCIIMVDDLNGIELKEGELYTTTTFKYDYAIKDYDLKLEALIENGSVVLVDVKKTQARKAVKVNNATNKSFVRYSQKKVKAI